MRWRAAVAALAALLVQTVFLVPLASAVRAEPTGHPSSWLCSAEALGLEDVNVELAPVSPDEYEQDGSPIAPAPGQDGSWVPVILVHGWTAHGTHPNTDGTLDTQGTFSGLIDLWARPGPGQQGVPRSLVGQLQGIPGAAVFTYDYHPYSGRWVTDEHIGPGLGRTIQCLGEASGKDVIVVGHSMGGLALREALTNEDVADHVAVGITVGTPHEGSVAAAILAGTMTAGQIASLAGGMWTVGMVNSLTLILSACGEASSEEFESGTLCDALAPPIRAFDGPAGQALRAGSQELKELPPMPDNVPFHPLAGRSNMDMPGEGWFWFPGPRQVFDLGDIVVGSDSALPNHAEDTHYDINCSYRLTPAMGPHDSIRLLLGILGPEDQTQEPGELFRGACFHSSLTRNIEITNEVMGITLEHIEAQMGLPPGLDVSSYATVDFSSPSGQIHCNMSYGTASCHFPAGIDTSGLPSSRELCGEHFGLVGVGVGREVGWVCSGGALSSPSVNTGTTEWFNGTGWQTAPFQTSLGTIEVATLPYGEILRMGTLSCYSAEDGVRCQRADTGASFWVARRGVEMYGPQTDRFSFEG